VGHLECPPVRRGHLERSPRAQHLHESFCCQAGNLARPAVISSPKPVCALHTWRWRLL
jgi:hypothetical protein